MCLEPMQGNSDEHFRADREYGGTVSWGYDQDSRTQRLIARDMDIDHADLMLKAYFNTEKK